MAITIKVKQVIAIGYEKEEQFQAFIISLIGKFEVKSVKLKYMPKKQFFGIV